MILTIDSFRVVYLFTDGHLDNYVVIYGTVWMCTFRQRAYYTCAASQWTGKNYTIDHTISLSTHAYIPCVCVVPLAH